ERIPALMGVGTAVALVLALVSTTLTNLAYLREHNAAAELPVLCMRRPLQSARLLLEDRLRLGDDRLPAVRRGAGARVARARPERRRRRDRGARLRLRPGRPPPPRPPRVERRPRLRLRLGRAR